MAETSDGTGAKGTTKPGIERELKFACGKHDELRAGLLAAGAKRTMPLGLEDNIVFDRQGELGASGRLLRLRRDGHGARLTYKGRARFRAGVKERQERECGVEEADALEEILELLGFEIVDRYQKRREEWCLGQVTIALDETPIGLYAEFEGDGAEVLAARLGLDLGRAERRSYLRLYRDHRKRHPEAPERMLFVPDGTGRK